MKWGRRSERRADERRTGQDKGGHKRSGEESKNMKVRGHERIGD